MSDTLTETTEIILSKEIELVAKGYTPEQATASIKRSRRWAESIARKVSTDIRDRIFLDLFRTSLQECENWIDKSKEAMTTKA